VCHRQVRAIARVTFLSATPIDVCTTLVSFGVPEDAILVAAEEVVTGPPAETPGLRAIHGDVRVRIEQGEGLLPALDRHRDSCSRRWPAKMGVTKWS
jgi:hypothetical protein